MAVTPKPVRRNGGNCTCPDGWRQEEYDEGTCQYGYCFSAKCRTCGGEIWGMGPVACRCDGAPRWARHPGMAERGHWDFEADKFVRDSAAVKPSSVKFRRDRAAFR